METTIDEFETYIAILESELKVHEDLKTDIASEIRQSLYDMYTEALVKGYGLENGIAHVLSNYESPTLLAKTFNQVHKQGLDMKQAASILFERRNLLVAALTVMLLAMNLL